MLIHTHIYRLYLNKYKYIFITIKEKLYVNNYVNKIKILLFINII